jgi:sortase B
MKRYRWVFFGILVIVLVVFFIAGTNLFRISEDYQAGADEYNELRTFTTKKTQQKENNDDDSKKSSDKNNAKTDFSVDFGALRQINPDCMGWIRFEKIAINYPIVKSRMNEYYLTHSFSKELRSAGSIFMEYKNASDLTDANTYIYGHNMKDGTMFAKLNQYANEGFFRANPDFWIYTPKESFHYDIFSCYVVSIRDETLLDDYSNRAEFGLWLNKVRGKSIYNTGIMPNASDKIVTLMTCTPAGDDYRFLVQGVLRR